MGQSLHLCPFSSAPSLAQADERDSKGVPPPWCPEGRQRPSFVHFERGHTYTWQQPRMSRHSREGLAASILYLPSMTIKQRGALTSPPSHDPPWCLTGFLKGQIFPLRSHSLGLCSSRPSPVSQLAFPQRSIISPSSPGQLRVAATNIRGRNVLWHLGQGERAAWLISLRRLWLLRRLWFRRGAKARPALVYLSVNQE